MTTITECRFAAGTRLGGRYDFQHVNRTPRGVCHLPRAYSGKRMLDRSPPGAIQNNNDVFSLGLFLTLRCRSAWVLLHRITPYDFDLRKPHATPRGIQKREKRTPPNRTIKNAIIRTEPHRLTLTTSYTTSKGLRVFKPKNVLPSGF